jgi:hypothetical protein
LKHWLPFSTLASNACPMVRMMSSATFYKQTGINKPTCCVNTSSLTLPQWVNLITGRGRRTKRLWGGLLDQFNKNKSRTVSIDKSTPDI